MTNNLLKIGSNNIGEKFPVFVIAEIGVNHEGNPDICSKMIKEAAKVGANAIKLQTMDPHENYAADSNSYKIFKKVWLTPEITMKMFDYARDLGLEPFTTVGDFKTLGWVAKLNPVAYKISSGLVSHIPLIEKISLMGKPIILSTGTANFDEIDMAVNVIKKNKNKSIVLLHCVSAYPTPFEQANLIFIKKMLQRYPFPIGYSDHTLGDLAVISAVSLGSCVIEKHFTLDNSRKSFDHSISLNPKEFSVMVKNIHSVKKMVKNNNFSVSPIEQKNKEWMRRVIIANKDLTLDKKITTEDILYLRQRKGKEGIPASEVYKILGKKIKKEVSRLEPILWKNIIV